MGKRGVFRGLKTAFRNEEKQEETHDDILRELKAEVEAIKEMDFEAVNAEDVLSEGWGRTGDMVYIINLRPMYQLIGGKQGRLAESLRETCITEFKESVETKAGRSSFEQDSFFMRFHDRSTNEGLRLAVEIVNKIGNRTFGDRFRTMEVPNFLVTADAGDIVDGDGELDLVRARDVIDEGGIPVMGLEEPTDGSPAWLSLHWQRVKRQVETLKRSKSENPVKEASEWAEQERAPRKKDISWEVGAAPKGKTATRPNEVIGGGAPRRAEATWGENGEDQKELEKMAREFIQRGGDRRIRKRAIKGTDRRLTFDRRGRGY